MTGNTSRPTQNTTPRPLWEGDGSLQLASITLAFNPFERGNHCVVSTLVQKYLHPTLNRQQVQFRRQGMAKMFKVCFPFLSCGWLVVGLPTSNLTLHLGGWPDKDKEERSLSGKGSLDGSSWPFTFTHSFIHSFFLSLFCSCVHFITYICYVCVHRSFKIFIYISCSTLKMIKDLNEKRKLVDPIWIAYWITTLICQLMTRLVANLTFTSNWHNLCLTELTTFSSWSLVNTPH